MKHDITHNVSLTTYVYYDSFAGKDSVQFHIDKDGVMYDVTFNNATDLRICGDVKAICIQLEVKFGNHLIINKKHDGVYSISPDRSFGASKRKYYPFFTSTRRHLIATITGDRFSSQYVR